MMASYICSNCWYVHPRKVCRNCSKSICYRYASNIGISFCDLCVIEQKALSVFTA